MLIIIAPNFFTKSSNGHLACSKIWQSLVKKLGEQSVQIVSGEECIQSVNYYRDTFGASYMTEAEFKKSRWLDANTPFCLLVPDDIGGTRSTLASPFKESPQCARIYTIAYAPIDIFAEDSSTAFIDEHDSRHRIIYFAKWIMPPRLRISNAIDIYQEPEPSVELMSAMQRNLHQSGDTPPALAIYAGKGVYKLSDHNKKIFKIILESFNDKHASIELITRHSPPHKNDLYDLLAKCRLLICLDPFSNIEREAVMLGCSVWKPNPGQAENIPGIYYGELCESQIQDILRGATSGKRHASETYLQYSELLKRSSITKLAMLCKAIERDMLVATGQQCATTEKSLLADLLILCFSDQLKIEAMQMRTMYSTCIHSMVKIPELNNSLPLESALNLLQGAPSSAIEVEYESICSKAAGQP